MTKPIHIVRYGELVPCKTAFIDAHTPGSDKKENFTIIGGGVSANSGLRQALSKQTDWNVFIPPLSFTTDNAAMIAVAGYFKYQNNNFGVLDRQAQSRMSL